MSEEKQVIPKVIWEERVAAFHAENPVGYNETPQIHPENYPFPSTISTPI